MFAPWYNDRFIHILLIYIGKNGTIDRAFILCAHRFDTATENLSVSQKGNSGTVRIEAVARVSQGEGKTL
jgi:hypothetical protein